MQVTQADLDALKSRLGARIIEQELQIAVLERLLNEALQQAQPLESAPTPLPVPGHPARKAEAGG